MAIRPIDGNELKNQILHMPRTVNPDLVQYSLVQAIIANMPTLTPPNEPLSIEQLREMDGESAWWDDGDGSCWGIISVDSAGMWGGIPFFRGRWRGVNFEYNIEERKMKIYRRPPEGEANG